MRERWRLVTDFDASPERAMGLDEVLLRAADPRPTLRFYTWLPSALSLGYFQRVEDVPAARLVPRVVRRITGGGAIHHHRGELTYSIAAEASHPLFQGAIAASYARVHGVLVRALAEIGIDARLVGSAGARSDVPATGMCFHASTPLDVAWDGRKGIGSAQRRTGGRVLHHGSIKLGPSPHEPEVATFEGAGCALAPEALAAAWLPVLARGFSAELVPREASAAELLAADALGARAAAPEFVRDRRWRPAEAGAPRLTG